jgi:DNA replication and repair protein RecF
MHLDQLQLFNFKNYESAELQFHPEVNCFLGKNGSGKTNILDAIHVLGMTKSAFGFTDNQLIRHGNSFFSVIGKFRNENNWQVRCSLKKGEKKEVVINKQKYEKMSDHIGRFPVVLIAPNDTDMIRDPSETRRKFIDSLISQLDSAYLNNLIRYNRALKQRNSLLKQFADNHYYDVDLLEPYEHEMATCGEQIMQGRNSFMNRYKPVVQKYYGRLSEQQEEMGISYHTRVEEGSFLSQLTAAREKDRVMQRSTIGIHRDDFVFEIDERPVKRFGSQGQQKSFVIAVKLAQADIIRQEREIKPLLLLDDIFDKLDDFRIQRLSEEVVTGNYGQLFLTDARPERTMDILRNRSYVSFNIHLGNIKSEI